MKYIALTLLLIASVAMHACDGNRQNRNDSDPLTAEDGTPQYKDYEIDSLTIRVDESTETLDREIQVVQDDVDSLLGDF